MILLPDQAVVAELYEMGAENWSMNMCSRAAVRARAPGTPNQHARPWCFVWAGMLIWSSGHAWSKTGDHAGDASSCRCRLNTVPCFVTGGVQQQHGACVLVVP